MTPHNSADAPVRPPSAVSTGVGLAGLAGLAVWMTIAILFELEGPYSALANVAACGIPMVLWSLLVNRVHLNPTTGIDWDKRPLDGRELADVSRTKLVGLWATWALIAGTYCIARFYWRGDYVFAMQLFAAGAIPLLVLSVPYVFWLDRRLVEPRDGAWHLGAFLLMKSGVSRRGDLVSLAGLGCEGLLPGLHDLDRPGQLSRRCRGRNFNRIEVDPVALAQWLIAFMFVIDIAFATVGYLLTMRPLDAHIRSATPLASGWAAALICYPPFILMNSGDQLDYRQGAQDWHYWFQAHPTLLALTGFVLVALTGIYAWATVAFGLRFSNLTHRGILTHGPYAFSKHPAYLSKNLFWWIAGMPFLVTTDNIVDAVRNTALLAAVSGVYYWRAKTEEWHLSADPAYRAYADWMARHGPVTRLMTRGQS